MSDGFGEGCSGGNFAKLLAHHIGQTVTIFTSSGGQSGSGFTGIILSVNEVFVRLITRIGPPPGCSLGNSCNNFNTGHGAGHCGYGYGSSYGPVLPGSVNGSVTSGGWDGYPVYSVGSVTDIPIANIVSFVHNAV